VKHILATFLVALGIVAALNAGSGIRGRGRAWAALIKRLR